jgi:Na+-driven multidrug efflux pump
MEVMQCLSGVMRGAGDTMTPMWISVVNIVCLRVPLAYLIAYFTRSEASPRGSFYCLPISLLSSWILGALITIGFYALGRWKKKAVIPQRAANYQADSYQTDSQQTD